MKIAVMQPYFFPYIGYFQLIDAVDKFVFYDDVNFITRGWINRNKIIVNDAPYLFTVPLKNASQFSLIKETGIHPELYKKWRPKFLKTLKQNYAKAPFFNYIYPLIEEVLEEEENISTLAVNSIKAVSSYLNLPALFFNSSQISEASCILDRADRLICITKHLDGNIYINPSGGKDLYDKMYFKKQNINLFFLEPGSTEYHREGIGFVSGDFSIIDILMHNSKEEVQNLLKLSRIK